MAIALLFLFLIYCLCKPNSKLLDQRSDRKVDSAESFIA